MPRLTLTRLFGRRHSCCCASPVEPASLADPVTPEIPTGPSLPLSLVTPGQTVTLVRIQDTPRFRRRVADLGLNLGLTVRVVKNDFHGPLILAVKNDTRLALGRGLAHQIFVQDTPAQEL